MKKKIKEILRNGLCKYYRLLNLFGLNYPAKAPVNFVIEKANWAIRWVGMYICENICAKHSGFAKITTNPASIINRIVHFGSQYMWVDWYGSLPKNKDYVVSFFHGKKSDSLEVEKHIEEFIKSQNSIYKIVTASSLVSAAAFSLDLGAVFSTALDEVSDIDSVTFSSVTVSVSDNVYHNLKGFKKHIHLYRNQDF